ncbi:ABC transporter substrate-binding protein [Campylobacter concisus]|uniref:sulfate ABC transporter ATP-binding protein n=1 Tax=Campylobacter concisus TaxID=199 RepID=UPI0018846517|nr:sulfate ABC transporter ATP-binding protein [Campylobacter concisus]MBE9851273.1 ABC transporter substrate-binding protein [Campylobacter concisus]
MLSGELLKSHFAKFDLVAMLSEFLKQCSFDKEKFQALRRDSFKSLDKSQREELLKIAGFKAYLDTKFQKFLRELMQSKIFVVSGVEYKFSELEIYTCFDANTYKRSCEAGEIYFHNFGFDISFKSEPALYGGILVRSLKPLKERNFIFGPRKCALHILNSKISNLNFDLKDADFRNDEVAFTPRIRSFKDETELQNDALRAVSGEFSKALESAKEYRKRVENAYKKG